MSEEKTCDECKGGCCKHVIVEIDVPEEIEDFEEIKWFVAHENVQVYVDEDYTWNLEFLTPCKFLNDSNKCNIYEKRPDVCRDYSQEECPFHNKYEETYAFKSIEDVEDYIKNVFDKGEHVIPDENSEEDEEEGEE